MQEIIKQYDHILLKDGREGCVVEVLGEQEVFIVDVGSSEADWDTIDIKRDEISKIMII